MAKRKDAAQPERSLAANLPQSQVEAWVPYLNAIANRFDREYQGKPPEVPPEVESLPIFADWAGGKLTGRIASPFWELAKPKKNQHCLDLGCGLSFLIYPWREWEACFYGQEISSTARDILQSRGPQLNSKLFKGVTLAPAHRLNYEDNQFDLTIATGFSCYFPLDYWQTVLAQVQRVLKLGGQFVFDVVDPDAPLAENWAILETYLDAEVFLEPLNTWKRLIKEAGGQVMAEKPGELFHLYRVRFAPA